MLLLLLHHLDSRQQSGVIALIDRFSCYFSDIPTWTTVLEHNLLVNSAKLNNMSDLSNVRE